MHTFADHLDDIWRQVLDRSAAAGRSETLEQFSPGHALLLERVVVEDLEQLTDAAVQIGGRRDDWRDRSRTDGPDRP